MQPLAQCARIPTNDPHCPRCQVSASLAGWPVISQLDGRASVTNFESANVQFCTLNGLKLC
jgi:hypothetical protein